MKTVSAFTGLLAIGVTFVGNVAAQYECYNSGRTELTGHLIRHSQRACEGYDGIQGRFQGTFQPREFRSVCVNLPGGNRLNMEVQNLNTQRAFDLRDSDCTKEFHNIANECNEYLFEYPHNQGGYATVAGWWFKIDPNSGRC
ncbi:hypothetical protein B0I35DRAFT_482063 [Stachybotrys elegans]|uniref:Secreted protein n=1 Tax=Stachybotrys elegans TaxID=80388 RepID=A0A8K0SFH6_9HYPO|nr:hypothetical protein B0I35DRAFT_482063 [Stachybotrys elegans]